VLAVWARRTHCSSLSSRDHGSGAYVCDAVNADPVGGCSWSVATTTQRVSTVHRPARRPSEADCWRHTQRQRQWANDQLCVDHGCWRVRCHASVASPCSQLDTSHQLHVPIIAQCRSFGGSWLSFAHPWPVFFFFFALFSSSQEVAAAKRLPCHSNACACTRVGVGRTKRASQHRRTRCRSRDYSRATFDISSRWQRLFSHTPTHQYHPSGHDPASDLVTPHPLSPPTHSPMHLSIPHI
jgi:hypothetical protein